MSYISFKREKTYEKFILRLRLKLQFIEMKAKQLIIILYELYFQTLFIEYEYYLI
jgi:hypothetical protein